MPDLDAFHEAEGLVEDLEALVKDLGIVLDQVESKTGEIASALEALRNPLEESEADAFAEEHDDDDDDDESQDA